MFQIFLKVFLGNIYCWESQKTSPKIFKRKTLKVNCLLKRKNAPGSANLGLTF